MATFDSIVQQARALSHADRLRLAHVLVDEAKAESEADEVGAGKRGLATWTDSTREDWSEFYPASLRKRKVG